MKDANALGMSDEDFLKLNDPSELPQSEGGVEEPVEEQAEPETSSDEGHEDPETAKTDDDTDIDGGEGSDHGDDDQKEEAEKQGEEDTPGDSAQDDDDDEESAKAPVGDKPVGKNPKSDGESEKEAEGSSDESAPDYKAFYDEMMAPFKANGKTIELKSPEEALQMKQMGANYTRKMQELAPHRKLLIMLEKNELLDEGKLSYLIDIEKKNPEAIKKLIKDSGIDPIDIDTDEESSYKEGNHRVSDEEEGFRSTLDELSSNPEGRETLQLINTQWDQASKEILWTQPDVMTLIHNHRSNGIYESITGEMDRQRSLGAIPPNVTFLQAYKKIGDDLANAGAFDKAGSEPDTKPQSSPVATRAATPKTVVRNSDKASAASSSRNSSRKAESVVNPLSLSDEDFEKEFARYQGRV